MGSVSTQCETRHEVVFRAEVRAHALCRMTREQVSSARRKPGNPPEGWPAVQPSLLRNSDDQTIVAIAAIHATLRRTDQGDPRDPEHWGILVSSRFLGRSSLVVALNRFRSDGVWGVSPHLIPHYALHSPAGTLSLALGVHGPNLGVGGGLWSEFEGILTALTWLKAGIVPGLWLVFSGWSPEFVPDREGESMADCECQALAVVLGPPSSAKPDRPCFQVVAGEEPESPRPLDLTVLAGCLNQSSREGGRGSRIARDLVVHDGQHDPGIPGPHFAPRPQRRSRARTIASDASGRLRVELLSPRFHQVKEVG
ncbi:MAG TPA: hypothetical protein VKF17_14525 [Isosphaeraceae bacterium]|nr:hypothetical protein [Isosphaeraceae bacterium]